MSADIIVYSATRINNRTGWRVVGLLPNGRYRTIKRGLSREAAMLLADTLNSLNNLPVNLPS